MSLPPWLVKKLKSATKAMLHWVREVSKGARR
jgi:hypothetical protein